jgi:hypothetical protein
MLAIFSRDDAATRFQKNQVLLITLTGTTPLPQAPHLQADLYCALASCEGTGESMTAWLQELTRRYYVSAPMTN